MVLNGLPKSTEPGVDFKFQFHMAREQWEGQRPVISPVVNQIHVKPAGGFWTSTFTPQKQESSAWVEWCASESQDWITKFGYVLEVLETARIYSIESVGDLEKLLRDYDPVVWRSKNFELEDKYLNYELISKDFDGVHLTEDGQWRTRMSKPGLYGWDCESTLWFRDVFGEVVPYKGKFYRGELEVSQWQMYYFLNSVFAAV